MNLKAGHKIMTGPDADILPGNCLPIANIPVGEMIHCIELYPGKGAQLVRAAGDAAQLMAKENGMAQVRLPSGEVRYVREECKATIGQVGNTDWANIQIGKAGRKRHMGWRPTVRGSVMNPCDHPPRRRRGQEPGRPSRPGHPLGQAGYGLQDPQAEEPHREVHRQAPQREVREAVKDEQKYQERPLLRPPSCWKRVDEMNQTGEKKVLKTWSRASTIFPSFVGHTFAVHDGRTPVPVYVRGDGGAHTGGVCPPPAPSTATPAARLVRRRRETWKRKHI